jgi:hypothetical protein
MAFEVFVDQNVDRAVVEVGLGGRLDATNVVKPELCVIAVDFDHEEWLGKTIEAIAFEKAGILKPRGAGGDGGAAAGGAGGDSRRGRGRSVRRCTTPPEVTGHGAAVRSRVSVRSRTRRRRRGRCSS